LKTPERLKTWVLRQAASRRVRWIVGSIVGVVALYAIVGFLIAPPIVRQQLEKQLSATLHRPVTVERVRINPFALTATVEKLSVGERQGSGKLLGFDTVYVNVASQSLFRLAPVIESLRIVRPYVHVVRNQDRTYSIQDLLDEFTAPKPEQQPTDKPPPQFAIFNIELADGTIEFDDRPEKTSHSITEVGLGVPFISSIPSQVDIRVQPRLAAKVNGAPFELAGETKPFKDTHETTLRLSLEGLEVARYLEYSPVDLKLKMPSGLLDVQLAVSLATLQDKLQTLTLSGTAALRDVKLQSANGAPLLAFEALRVELESLDLVARKASVNGLTLQKPVANVVRTKDGSLNWVGLVAPAPPSDKPAPGAQAASKEAPFAFTVRSAAIAGGRVEVVDQSATQPFKLAFDSVALNLHDIARAAEREAPIRAPAVELGLVTEKGKASFKGALQVGPLKVDGALAVEGFRVPVLAAYYDQWLNVVVNDGSFATKGTLVVEQPAGQPLRASYRGDAAVTNFASRDKAGGQDLLRWGSLTASGLDFQLEPLAVRVNQVTLADFYSRLIVESNATLNLQGVFKQPGTPAGKAAEKPPARPADSAKAPAARMAVGRIVFERGQVNFSDFFVKPNYSADLIRVRGTVSEMTPEKAGDVNLHASVGRRAPVEVAGKINPFGKDLFLDITANARGVEMPPLSPYAVKYAGYGIASGKLSLKAKYHLEKRQLQAENNIYLEQLTFGPHVDSPTATKLPVTLAIALLKDRNGVIDIDLPISGSLDDPKFSIGAVLVRAFVNLITRVVTSPFALLGKIVGHGDGQELSYVEFRPGRSTIATSEQGKLGALAKALEDRPQLKLEITGRADPEADRRGLRRVALERQILALKLKQSGGKDSKVPATDPQTEDVRLPPDEYAKLLTTVYRDAKFDRPRNALGFLKELPVPEMEQLMFANTPVSDADLRSLADARAQAAKDWLAAAGKVAADRLVVEAAKVEAQDGDGKGRPTRAEFSFR
jgi:uncharacterized protein involved in outer membrane biogenesis